MDDNYLEEELFDYTMLDDLDCIDETEIQVTEYQTVVDLPKKITFIVKDIEDINANSACYTNLSELSDTGRLRFHDTIASCTTRGGDSDMVIEDCRKLILKQLHLQEKEWSVIFTSNATESLNMATALIYNYTRNNKINYRYFVSAFAHNSLYLPAQKQSIIYKHNLEIFDIFNVSMFKNSVISIPYIDNILGFNHWKSCFNQVKLKEMGIHSKSQNTIIDNTHIIVDAAQAGLTLFNPVFNQLHPRNRWKFLPKLDFVSAIALSGHKFHAPHIGILVIRKEFIEQDLFLIPEIKVGGGAVSYISTNPNKASKLLNNHDGLESGLINTESIYGLYNWLLCLSAINNNFLETPSIARVWFKNQIHKNLSNFTVIDRQLLDTKFKNILSGNNIILIDCGAYFSVDVVNALKLNNIESRDGSFCCDLAIDQLNLSNNLLRLSFDYTFTKAKAEKIFNVLLTLNNEINKI